MVTDIYGNEIKCLSQIVIYRNIPSAYFKNCDIKRKL